MLSLFQRHKQSAEAMSCKDRRESEEERQAEAEIWLGLEVKNGREGATLVTRRELGEGQAVRGELPVHQQEVVDLRNSWARNCRFLLVQQTSTGTGGSISIQTKRNRNTI